MVLGNRMIIVLLTFNIFLSISCKNNDLQQNILANEFKETDKIICENYELRLIYNSKNNYLVYKNHKNGKEDKIALSIMPPCYFGRFPDGKPKKYSYTDVKVKAVLIIIGSPEIDDVSSNEKFINYVQRVHGVLIYEDDGIMIANKIMRRIAVDINAGLDEKDFYSFAHYFNPRLKNEISKPDN